ncbi:MAG: hypothetical protein AAGF85_18350 [Bacteroidota bacterium]
MEAEIIKGISIFLLTMLKFIAGPTLGYAAGFSFLTTVLITVGGMMASVVLFTYLGTYLREKIINRLFKKKKVFSSRSRRFVTIWKKYGIVGVSFLTPLLLTPIGGTIVLTSFGSPKNSILLTMLVSAIFWSLVFVSLIYAFGTAFLERIIH